MAERISGKCTKECPAYLRKKFGGYAMDFCVLLPDKGSGNYRYTLPHLGMECRKGLDPDQLTQLELVVDEAGKPILDDDGDMQFTLNPDKYLLPSEVYDQMAEESDFKQIVEYNGPLTSTKKLS